jgi:hypothetical protein
MVLPALHFPGAGKITFPLSATFRYFPPGKSAIRQAILT